MNGQRRTRRRIFIVFAIFSCAALAYDGNVEKGAPEVQLKVGDENFPVYFEDRTVTDAEETTIVEDYQRIIDQLSHEGRRTFSNPKRIGNGNTEVQVVGALGLSTKNVKKPDEFEHEFGLIGQFDDRREFIVIRKKLSDGYKASMALKHSYEEAFRALPQFIHLLNHLKENEMPGVADFFYLHGIMKKRREAFSATPKQEVIEAYGKFRYTCVSILELQLFDDRLMSNVYAVGEDGNVHNRPVIFDDGRWKVLMVRSE